MHATASCQHGPIADRDREDDRWRRHRDAASVGDRRSLHGRRSSCPAGARPSCARSPGPPGAPTLLLLHGWVASGGLNWFQAFEPLARALPRDRPRPARPRPRPALPPHLPARRLRRRLRGDARRARHRPGHRGRLLDGRPGRAAAVAPAPRPRRRDSCCCATVARVHPELAARASRTSRAMLGRRGAARASPRWRAPMPGDPAFGRATRVDCRRGSPPRCAATTGA